MREKEQAGVSPAFPGRPHTGPVRLDASQVAAYYADPPLYAFYNRERREDIAFYRRMAVRAGGPILELGCGEGRLTFPIAHVGVDVTAVDASADMLAELRRKLTWRRHATISGRIHPVEGDIRALDLGRRFPLVIMPFNTLQHLYTPKEAQRAFRSARRHLAPGGRLIFDLTSPDPEYLSGEEGRQVCMEVMHPRFRLPATFYGWNAYDPETRINHAWHCLRWTDRSGVEREQRAVLMQRQYFPKEIRELVEKSGFAMENFWGDFRENDFATGSPYMVCVCRPAKG